jgi:hypothetical protein
MTIEQHGTPTDGLKPSRIDARGVIPESWDCIDCGANTAPGCSNRLQIEQALTGPIAKKGVPQTFDDWTEVYMVKPAVWKAADMDCMAGCLCIGCLESGWAGLRYRGTSSATIPSTHSPAPNGCWHGATADGCLITRTDSYDRQPRSCNLARAAFHFRGVKF